MTTPKHILRLAFLAMAILPFVACRPDAPVMKSIEFTGTIEPLAPSDSKVYFSQEKYIMWEEGDKISITSDACYNNNYIAPAWLAHGTMDDYENYNGVFNTDLPENSKYFMALHPFSQHNVIHSSNGSKTFSDIRVFLPHTQTYRNDSTFDKQVIPMIAHYDGEWASDPTADPFNLDFHTLASLVRLQFFNKTSDSKKIDQIVITSTEATPRQLSGLFEVEKAHTADPYLQNTGSNPEGDEPTEIVLSMPSGGLDFAPNALNSFYVVLPAYKGKDIIVPMNLKVRMETTDGEVFEKEISVGTRRKSITYLRAIGVTEFKPIITTADAEQGLVGNGTENRPFKVYTLADLNYLKKAFANPIGGVVYINGQKITENTEFRLMRNDIVLDGTWTTGIENFTGHIQGNSALDKYSVTNNTNVPLFTSISDKGHVENISVKVTSVSGSLNKDFSPFCTQNHGKMTSCNFTTGSTAVALVQDAGYTYAGVCLENRGTLEKCGVSNVYLRFSNAEAKFAGVCGTNMSTIQACEASSTMTITSTPGGYGPGYAAGVCYANQGTVKECYYGASQADVGAIQWGGVVFSNESTGSVEKCYFDGMLASTSSAMRSAIGGIVCLNAGVIDNCYVASGSTLEGNQVGGIVAIQEGASARIVNCRIKSSTVTINHRTTVDNHYCGGLVAEVRGGSVENSFAAIDLISVTGIEGRQGSVVGLLNGGEVKNCYGYSAMSSTQPFCAKVSSGTLNDAENYLVGTTLTSPTAVAVTKDALNGLLDKLNANKPSDGMGWTRNEESDTDMPTHVIE